METARQSRRKVIHTVWIFISIPVVLLAGLFGVVAYVNWAAEKKANQFCSQIEIGTQISLAAAKAKSQGVFFGSDAKSYTFYFFGFVFDKAICDVTIGADGKVVSKYAGMEYD